MVLSCYKHIMGKQPLISIVTPVYNMERFLPQCIDSILAQTFPDWELILVDDGSTDGSAGICDRYAAKDSRIRVIHKENSGQADSRNIGVSMARADLVGFVDSDDWIDPGMYGTLYDALVNNGADISICGYYMSYVNREQKSCDTGGGNVVFSGKEALNHILDDKVIKNYLWDKLYKKEVITEQFPKAYYYEDYATLFKWFANVDKVAFCQVPLYHYRQREGSTVHDCDPRKKYHFFLAEQERFNFLRMKRLLPERRREFKAKVVKCGVQEIKEIVRKSGYGKPEMDYISKIRSGIQPYLPVSFGELGVRKYFRLIMVQHFIWLYLRTMRAERHIVSNRMMKNWVYYE